jgi:hypothetical protein
VIWPSANALKENISFSGWRVRELEDRFWTFSWLLEPFYLFLKITTPLQYLSFVVKDEALMMAASDVLEVPSFKALKRCRDEEVIHIRWVSSSEVPMISPEEHLGGWLFCKS